MHHPGGPCEGPTIASLGEGEEEVGIGGPGNSTASARGAFSDSASKSGSRWETVANASATAGEMPKGSTGARWLDIGPGAMQAQKEMPMPLVFLLAFRA